MSWWRANRWWLLALPVAVLVAAATSSYHVREWWWDNGLHHRVATGERGEPLAVTLPYDDALGPTSRSFTVELVAVEPSATYPFQGEDEPAAPQDGVEAVALTLDWAAEPDQVLRGCRLSVVDDEGRRYDVDTGDVPYACVPEGAGGPEQPLSRDGVRGQVPGSEDERPATWSTSPLVLVPEGTELMRVLVWWGTPDYAELSVS